MGISKEKIDKILLELSAKEKLSILRDWNEYSKKLPAEGQKIMKERIAWLRESLPEKVKKLLNQGRGIKKKETKTEILNPIP